MTGSSAPLLIFLSLAILQPAQSEQGPPGEPVVLNHVTVIDGTGSAPQRDMTVVVIDNRIVALGKAATVRVPPDAQVIDATDKFLIPGLWDMHAHPFLTRQTFFPQFVFNLYVANGVTGLRDMFGPLEEEQQWQKGIDVGTILGPRMVMAGPLLDGAKSVVSGSTIVTNEAEARRAVLEVKERGADFVKVYERLSREAYFAIADEANKQGLAFVGHVPARMTAAEASDAGQKSIEHLTNIAVSCSSEEAALQTRWSAALLEPDSAISLRELARSETLALETLDEQRCHALADRFAKNGTWHDPTLVVLRASAFGDDSALGADPRLKYVPRAIRETWNPARHELWRAFTPQDFVKAQKAFPKFLRIVGIMHAAGVKFLAGTDPPVPYCIPGFSIHDELALLVEAGLTPMEALQTATRNPAEFLGLLDSLGTVEQGKIADLVLLDADPLQDIRNTQAIRAVVLNGKFLSKDTLGKMLVEVASADDQTPGAVRMFDGVSLNGWEGDIGVWRVVDGAIVGGTLETPVTQSEYLCTRAEFANFELRLSARIMGGPNAGVHFRSQRVPGSNEVAGYQADIGFAPGRIIAMLSDTVPDSLEQPYPLWGSLADEFRPEPGRYPDPTQPVRLIAVAPSGLVERVLRPDDWNEIAVVAVGPRIRLQLNGVTTVDFTEKGNVPTGGKVCLQIHDGPPAEAWYKNISIREIAVSRR